MCVWPPQYPRPPPPPSPPPPRPHPPTPPPPPLSELLFPNSFERFRCFSVLLSCNLSHFLHVISGDQDFAHSRMSFRSVLSISSCPRLMPPRSSRQMVKSDNPIRVLSAISFSSCSFRTVLGSTPRANRHLVNSATHVAELTITIYSIHPSGNLKL